MEKFGLGPYKGQPNFTHSFQGFLKLQVNYLVAKNHPKKMEGWCGMGLGLLGLFLLILSLYSPYKQIPQALIIFIPILREELNQRESFRKIERKFSRIISREALIIFQEVFLDLVAHATVFGEIENSGEDQVVESRKNSIRVLRVLGICAISKVYMGQISCFIHHEIQLVLSLMMVTCL